MCAQGKLNFKEIPILISHASVFSTKNWVKYMAPLRNDCFVTEI